MADRNQGGGALHSLNSFPRTDLSTQNSIFRQSLIINGLSPIESQTEPDELIILDNEHLGLIKVYFKNKTFITIYLV